MLCANGPTAKGHVDAGVDHCWSCAPADYDAAHARPDRPLPPLEPDVPVHVVFADQRQDIAPELSLPNWCRSPVKLEFEAAILPRKGARIVLPNRVKLDVAPCSCCGWDPVESSPLRREWRRKPGLNCAIRRQSLSLPERPAQDCPRPCRYKHRRHNPASAIPRHQCRPRVSPALAAVFGLQRGIERFALSQILVAQLIGGDNAGNSVLDPLPAEIGLICVRKIGPGHAWAVSPRHGTVRWVRPRCRFPWRLTQAC